MRNTAPRRSRVAIVAATVAAAALMLTGCSGGAGAGSTSATASAGDIQAAQATVDASTKEPTFSAAGKPIDISSLKGDKVLVVPLASSPQNDAIHTAMEAVAAQTGIDLTVCQNQGQQSQWAQCMDQAISTNQDAIVLDADPSVLTPQLIKAKAAGIPVLSLHYFPEGVKPTDADCKGCDGITAVQSAPMSQSAALMADWAIADGEGNVNAIIPMISGLAPTVAMKAAMTTEFTTKCPACTFKFMDISMADVLGSGFQTSLSSVLNANTKANYVLNQADFLATGANAALTLADRSGMSMSGYNGISSALSLIAQGSAFKMDVGEPAGWVGYQAMDNVFRLLLGESVESGVATPVRVWTSENIAEAGTPPTDTDGYGDAYVAGFETLWGLR